MSISGFDPNPEVTHSNTNMTAIVLPAMGGLNSRAAESPEGYVNSVWFLPETCFTPLQFTDISEVTFYSNQDVGLSERSPCFTNAGKNHVFPFSQLGVKADEGYFLGDEGYCSGSNKHGEFRIVQSIDFFSLWIGRQGCTTPFVMAHCQGAKVRSLTDPHKLEDNDRAMNGGTGNYTVITESDGKKKYIIHTLTNSTGHFKSKFNDFQLLLIAMWNDMLRFNEMSKNEDVSICFADKIRFVMDENEWLSIPENQRPASRYYQIQKEDLIQLIERLKAKYTAVKGILSEENLQKYDRENRFPVTYIEVENAADLKRKRLELLAQEEERRSRVLFLGNQEFAASPAKTQKLMLLPEISPVATRSITVFAVPDAPLRKSTMSRRSNQRRTSNAQMTFMLEVNNSAEAKDKENTPPRLSFETPPRPKANPNPFTLEMMTNLENEAKKNEVTQQLVDNFREQVAPLAEGNTHLKTVQEPPRTPVKGF